MAGAGGEARLPATENDKKRDRCSKQQSGKRERHGRFSREKKQVAHPGDAPPLS
jgi:hypothetical protein